MCYTIPLIFTIQCAVLYLSHLPGSNCLIQVLKSCIDWRSHLLSYLLEELSGANVILN